MIETNVVDLISKDVAKEFDLPEKDVHKLIMFYWKKIKYHRLNFTDLELYLRGLGTFKVIYSRIDDHIVFCDKQVNTPIIDPASKERYMRNIPRLTEIKAKLDEQYLTRKAVKLSRKLNESSQGL